MVVFMERACEEADRRQLLDEATFEVEQLRLIVERVLADMRGDGLLPAG